MLLKDTNYISIEDHDSLITDCKELLRLLISIVKSTKDALKK